MAQGQKKVIKEVKGQGKLKDKVIAREYDDGTILLLEIRFSHPHIAKPYAGTNDDGSPQTPKYGVVGMLPKATHAPAKDLVNAAIGRMIQSELKIKPETFPPEKKFLRNGDTSGKEELIGYWTVSTREERRPAVRDANLDRLRDEGEISERFYGGAWGCILIRPWPQNHKKHGKRINAGLSAIQFLRHDEAFGQGRIGDDEVDEMFEAYGDEDDGNGGFDDDGLSGADEDLGGL